MDSQKATYRPFVLTFCSGICFVLAFYPVGWGWVGWLAPFGVLHLIQNKEWNARKPKTQIWLACFLCWLILFQCVRLPHWAGYIGWPILSAYLGSYLFFFVLISRHLVHRWNVSLLIAGPLVWSGLEYVQAHALTGISLGMLSHTQATYPIVIQVADLAGCYAVSFFIVAIASGAYLFVSRPEEQI